MSDKLELLVTVVFGKQSTSLSVPAQDPQALELLKTHIYEEFQLEPKFQRLVLQVKKKFSGVLGLSSPQSLRLVVKGKTPKDDAVLETLTGNKKVIKAMALLQAQQHVMQEKEEDLRELLNELASAQAALQRVQRQMARNFTTRDESLFQLSRVLDEGQRIADNLELVKQHLTGAKASGLRASEQTLAAVTQAIQEANSVTEAAQNLLETHSSF
ncbi:hypothetical protein GQ600_5717 [Phytophthora cactorum]|nr:hypothetical protein GQ600_5717 [Phytophthora cactorum]